MTANDSSPNSRLSHINSNCGYIEHYVSKLDTLAGLAIKYGVEVADVKRFNGLATDSQMYAHKMLKIPLYGKHPTKFNLSSSKLLFTRKLDVVDKYQIRSRNKKRSPSAAMELLRGYYGLSPSSQQMGNNEALLGLTVCEDHSDLESSSPFGELPLHGNTNVSAICSGIKIYSKRESSAEGSSPAVQDMSGHILSNNIPTVGNVNNERSVRRRFKGEIINLPASTEVSSDQDAKTLDESELNSVSMNEHEISLGSPVTILRVLDGALAGIKNKENASSKVRKPSSVASLQDQASFQVNSAVQKFISLVEEKLPSSITKNEAGVRGFADILPKLAYPFKTALD